MTIDLFEEIKKNGDAIYSTVTLFLESPEKIAANFPDKPRQGTAIHKNADGSIKFISFEPPDFCKLVAKYTDAKNVPYIVGTWALDNLVKNVAVVRANVGLYGTYNFFDHMIRPFLEDGELDGALLGYRYFLPRRRSALIEICVLDDKNDLMTGTGFVASFKDKVPRIVTCKHNLFDKSGAPRKIKFIKNDSTEFEITGISVFGAIDLCLLGFKHAEGIEPIRMRQGSLLDEVIVAGFPRVLFDEANPILYHRGEVNGWVGDIEKANFFGITSANVAPGNSGGPVFNLVGSAIGVISDEHNLSALGGIATHNLFIPVEKISEQMDRGAYEDMVL